MLLLCADLIISEWRVSPSSCSLSQLRLPAPSPLPHQRAAAQPHSFAVAMIYDLGPAADDKSVAAAAAARELQRHAHGSITHQVDLFVQSLGLQHFQYCERVAVARLCGCGAIRLAVRRCAMPHLSVAQVECSLQHSVL
jgi:hypothetical protein